jgi:two-component system response regulator MprA
MRPRIFLVEDAHAFAEVLTDLLVEEGFSVVHVRDGITALNMLASARLRYPDLVLCDVMLPGLRGDRLAREIRRRFPDARLPIVLMSASADPRVDLPDVIFMPKPFDSAELMRRIHAMLETASRSSAVRAT